MGNSLSPRNNNANLDCAASARCGRIADVLAAATDGLAFVSSDFNADQFGPAYGGTSCVWNVVESTPQCAEHQHRSGH
jgi:hypothetical protein